MRFEGKVTQGICIVSGDAGALGAESIFARCDANDAAKDLTKMALIHKARAGTGVENGEARIAKELLGPVNALAKHMLVRRNARALLEPSGEVVEVQLRNLCEFVQLEIFGDVGVDVLHHSPQTRRRETASKFVQLRFGV